MDALLQDLRHASRMLLKKPGFTIVAALTLALGIGANTAIFSVVNNVLLRPLPYNESERIMMLDETNPQQGFDYFGVSWPNFVDWREQGQSFEQIAAYRPVNLILTGGDEPARIRTALVTADLFPLLRVSPAWGRAFLPEEDRPGAKTVVVISHGFWQRRFAGTQGLIGQTITLNGVKATVIGIMPPGFQFPDEGTELWMPLGPLADQMKNRAVHMCSAIARLKPDITLPQAQAEMETIASRVQQQNPGADPGHGVAIVSLHERVVGDVRPALSVLLGAVAFVLLIACANVANLLLTRAAQRQKEMAIRVALGAGRWRMTRQMLTESLLLSAFGGTLGLLLALWGVDALAASFADLLPRAKEIKVDGQALAFTLLISLVTGVVFSLAPAVRASKIDLNESLKEGGGKGAGGYGHRRARRLLIISEVALSLVLLIGAGLLIKSFLRLTDVNPGFRPENLLMMTVGLPNSKYPETQQVVSFYRQLPERLEALPGVQSVSAASRLPISGGDAVGSLTIEGQPFPPEDTPAASFRRILPNYFRTMGIPLLQGREFDERDRGGDPKVVIVNESMARRFWPAGDAVGKRIKVGPPENEPWVTIVGVVGDVKNIGLDAGPMLATYEPHPQRPWSTMNVVVRTEADPLTLVATLRNEIRSADKDILIDNIGTMGQRIATSVANRRINMLLLSAFAAVAMLLAFVGIYGVMSYEVTQRTQEIGVRMALGAQPRDVLKLVIGQGLALALIGIAIGLTAALGLTRLMSSLLFSVSATDPLTFVSIVLLLAAAALLACYLPARRATKVDPMVALRYE